MRVNRSIRVVLAAITLVSAGAVVYPHNSVLATTTATPIKLNCKTVLKTKININSAKADELMCLNGIGPVIAKEIIKHRPYKDGKDLQKKVNGVGPKIWNDIKNFVKF